MPVTRLLRRRRSCVQRGSCSCRRYTSRARALLCCLRMPLWVLIVVVKMIRNETTKELGRDSKAPVASLPSITCLSSPTISPRPSLSLPNSLAQNCLEQAKLYNSIYSRRSGITCTSIDFDVVTPTGLQSRRAARMPSSISRFTGLMQLAPQLRTIYERPLSA